ncbi:MAG: hypothetical protein ABI401_08780 [Candidatus Dormibacter sp.]
MAAIASGTGGGVAVAVGVGLGTGAWDVFGRLAVDDWQAATPSVAMPSTVIPPAEMN